MALSNADAVKVMIESDAWKALLESRDAKLKQEQKEMMVGKPLGEEAHDRVVGKWAGLSSIEGLAQGIIQNAEKLREESRRQQEEAA